MLILKMAWRNILRNYRRSGITIAAMTLALVVELLYSGLVTGLVYGMEEDATAFELGDVQVMADTYLTRPSLYNAVPEQEALLKQLDDAGYPATVRLFSGGLAASGEASSGVSFVGLNPERDQAAMDLHLAIADGKWLDNEDPKGVIVGGGLARTLALRLGDEVVVLSQGADGSVANDLFIVRGVLMSVAAGLDRSAILMTETTFREMFVFPNGAHRILIRKPRSASLAEATDAVTQIVTASPASAGEQAVMVKNWKEISPFLAQYIDSVSSVVVIMYFIVYVAVGILILNAMLMAVFERIREFGVLKAIGYSPLHVLGIMLTEGMMQAAIATVLGLALAAPGMWYIQVHGINVGALGGVQMAGLTMPPVWNGYYTVETLQVPIIMLFIIVFLAVGYPALKAAWIRPVDAIRHQ